MYPAAGVLPPFDADQALRLARETFAIEAAALLGLSERLDQRFAKAVQKMLHIPGRVVVMGMGKSGHIGRKMAATLASTGTAALFVHTAEAIHGDLGMIVAGDAVLASVKAHLAPAFAAHAVGMTLQVHEGAPVYEGKHNNLAAHLTPA